MKIGVGKGDWRDSSHFKKLGAIYTKEVLWAFNRSITQHISSLLGIFFLPSLSQTPYRGVHLFPHFIVYYSFVFNDVIVLFFSAYLCSP